MALDFGPVRRRGAAIRWFALALLGTAAVLVAVGAIVAALTGLGTWHTIGWAFLIGGGALAVINFTGGASGPRAEPRIGVMFDAVVPESPPSAGWLFVGLALAGLGAVSLFA
jgi:hypothetical protein